MYHLRTLLRLVMTLIVRVITNRSNVRRQYVSSSNIASIGYDPDNQVLEIEFLSGAVYQYYDVPQSVYDGLMAADSHGKFLDVYIKKGGYRYTKI